MTLTDTIKWILDVREPVGSDHSEAALRAAAEALNLSLQTVYVWNDRRAGVAHIVPNVDDFDLYGDAATVCGAVAVTAGFGTPELPACPECVR